jgi:hypothetical protein
MHPFLIPNSFERDLLFMPTTFTPTVFFCSNSVLVKFFSSKSNALIVKILLSVSLTGIVMVLPFRITLTFKVSLGLFVLRYPVKSENLDILFSSICLIISPFLKPPFSAPELGSISEM